jgi:hypothetical protein
MNTHTNTRTTYAIGAHELRPGHLLIGRTRHGDGATVDAVNHEGGRVYAIVAGQPVELVANETVHVAR